MEGKEEKGGGIRGGREGKRLGRGCWQVEGSSRGGRRGWRGWRGLPCKEIL